MSNIRIYNRYYPYGIMQEVPVLENIANGLAKEVVEGLKRDKNK